MPEMRFVIVLNQNMITTPFMAIKFLPEFSPLS